MAKRSLLDRYYRWRSTYWHWQRLLFPSHAELRFMRLLGARLVTIRLPMTNRQLTIITSRGRILRRAKMHRDVRYGRFYVDFANDLNWIIEVDGQTYHMDVVADMEREIAIRELVRRRSGNRQDVRILRIPGPRLWNDSARVQRDVLAFLNS